MLGLRVWGLLLDCWECMVGVECWIVGNAGLGLNVGLLGGQVWGSLLDCWECKFGVEWWECMFRVEWWVARLGLIVGLLGTACFVFIAWIDGNAGLKLNFGLLGVQIWG
jgi:hypothetical protein